MIRAKLRSYIVKATYMKQALMKINNLHLGDQVIRRIGGKGITIQGVGAPYWDVLIDGGRYNGVHKHNLRLVNPVKGRIQRLKGYYEFKMTNWYQIDTYCKGIFDTISKSY
jgi:hypothetical protein